MEWPGHRLFHPVLLATGISPVNAAITNALGVTPATFALIAVRHQMRAYFHEYRKLIIISIIGYYRCHSFTNGAPEF